MEPQMALSKIPKAQEEKLGKGQNMENQARTPLHLKETEDSDHK